MAQRKSKKKKTSNTGLIFWLAFAIIIIICFLIAKGKIASVLKETNFFNEVVGTEPTIITELVNNHSTDNSSSTNKSDDPIIQLQLPEEIEQDEAELIERSEVTQKTEKSTEKSKEQVKTETKKETPKKETVEQVQMMKLNLCYVMIDSDGSVIRKEVIKEFPKNSSPLTTAINNLLSGPSADEVEKGYMSLIPEGTKLLGARVANKTATLNFSESFSFNRYGVQGYLGQLMQIVYTATSFSTIDNVQFLIEGQKLEYLGGEGVWIGSPLSRISFK